MGRAFVRLQNDFRTDGRRRRSAHRRAAEHIPSTSS
jgi:hypothetical protein